MNLTKSSVAALEDVMIDVKIKLSALWASAMFCYIYGDYFGLFQPGELQTMLQGQMRPLGPVTQTVLLGTSFMMSIPSVMVFLSLVLRPTMNRRVNIIVGVIFTLIMLGTMPGTWAFYIYLGSIEVVLTALIVWYAWTWPKQAAA